MILRAAFLRSARGAVEEKTLLFIVRVTLPFSVECFLFSFLSNTDENLDSQHPPLCSALLFYYGTLFCCGLETFYHSFMEKACAVAARRVKGVFHSALRNNVLPSEDVHKGLLQRSPRRHPEFWIIIKVELRPSSNSVAITMPLCTENKQ